MIGPHACSYVCIVQPRSGRFPLQLAVCPNTGAGGVEDGERFCAQYNGDQDAEEDEGGQSDVLAGAERGLI